MSNQNIKSDLVVELTTEEQELLSGGNRYNNYNPPGSGYNPPGYGYNPPGFGYNPPGYGGGFRPPSRPPVYPYPRPRPCGY